MGSGQVDQQNQLFFNLSTMSINIWKNKYQVADAFIDLPKAFDSLNHNILFNKIEYLAVRGVPLKLL